MRVHRVVFSIAYQNGVTPMGKNASMHGVGTKLGTAPESDFTVRVHLHFTMESGLILCTPNRFCQVSP